MYYMDIFNSTFVLKKNVVTRQELKKCINNEIDLIARNFHLFPIFGKIMCEAVVFLSA